MSEFTIVEPIETNEPHAAKAGRACMSEESRVRKTAIRTFMFDSF
jgi:hypothetical protein